MTARPWKPAVELEGALERGELEYSITLAAEVSEDQRRPLDLEMALRFLPVVAERRPGEFDAWALRWLTRWITETPGATVGRAAEIACSLADAQREPIALESVRKTLS
ncbi:MAG TPA: hypothetical protein VNZ01_00105 [Solirubrobacteraceae bacterium]|nr:hypothetical protein [Solirubrobacteraceae bacterium]